MAAESTQSGVPAQPTGKTLVDIRNLKVHFPIKGGLLAGRYFQRVASSIKEDVQDLTEEAKSDLDLEKEKPDTTPTTRHSKRPPQ